MTPAPTDKFEALVALGPGPHRVATPAGTVTLTDMAVTVDPDTGAVIVDLQADGYPDPHIRVINPPRYVPDPAGPIERGDPATGTVLRVRDDPLAALAHAVAQHGDPRATIRRGAQ